LVKSLQQWWCSSHVASQWHGCVGSNAQQRPTQLVECGEGEGGEGEGGGEGPHTREKSLQQL
jgi:hypothetical protein|tara:strand:+ start:267 stop:452 length:186 start_codon:yes stop_codon:yes gene_type:complete